MASAYRWLFCALLIATALLCVLAGCSRTPIHSAQSPAFSPAISANYVGNDACAACHPEEARRHNSTGHAHTLRQMAPDAAPSDDPPSGAIRDTELAIRRTASGVVVRNPATRKYSPLSLAFGSGKQGITYAAILDNATLFEMQYSYFPGTRRWYVTPGHEQSIADRQVLGMNLSGMIPRTCILCHATTLPENSLHIDPKFMGVGCESCHGPGSAHITAVKTPGAKDPGMASLAAIGGDKVNALCGKCHRTVEEVERMPLNQRVTQRFFPYGLAMSRCFQNSDNHLSCITCHDPHADLVKDKKYYEARCLSCHTPQQGTIKEQAGHAAEHSIICKVNPRTGCIPCHMPDRKSFPGTSLPIVMADHWIRINK